MVTRGLVLFTIVIALLNAGCVTRGQYDDLEERFEAKSSRSERLAAENESLKAALLRLRGERESLKENLASAKKQISSLNNSYRALIDELRFEVASGEIKIRQVADGIRVELTQEILFPSGGWDLDERGRQVIERVAGQIRERPAEVFVEGHTDDVQIGRRTRACFPTNWELAAARAASVVRMLADAGVDSARLRVVSRGPFAPIATNDTEEGRAKNRRIEILLRPDV